MAGDATRDGSTAVTLSDFVNSQFDPSAVVEGPRLAARRISDLPVLIKGVGAAEDARIAASEGLPAVVLSNHGGPAARRRAGHPRPPARRRWTPSATAWRCCSTAASAAARDLVVARALGARAVMVGRPYLYGLGAGGERGVGHVLDQLLAGAERTMALLGVATRRRPDRRAIRSR